MDADVKKENLSSVQQLGVEMTVRYMVLKYFPRVFLGFVWFLWNDFNNT